MTEPADPALLQALLLFRAPRSARPGPDERLPEGMLTLLRIVAGEEQAMAQAQEHAGESAQVLRESAGFYIQQVMFAQGSSSYRVLGVDPDVPDERIREHFRWLARWLHPDRNPDDWETVYSERVNRAWQHLRTTERRLQYDNSLRESAVFNAENPRAPVVLVRRAVPPEAAMPQLNLRWLPKAIFAGLGVSALATVAVFYLIQNADSGRGQPVESPAQTAVALDPELPAIATTSEPILDPVVRVPDVSPVVPVASAPTARVEKPVQHRELVSTPVAHVVHRNQVAVQGSARLEVAHATSKRHDFVPLPVAASPVVATALQIPEPSASVVAMTTQATSPPPRRASVEEIDANRVLGHFSQAYAEGNLDGMRAMFTADASSPLGGLGAILANYGRLFESSRERSLVVRDVSWFTTGATLTIIASYQATVTNSRKHQLRRTHGDLRLDLRREDEQWRIYRLLHDERPG